MNEYIEKAELIKKLCFETAEWSNSPTIKTIKEFPAADVQPVKRGRWIEKPTVAYCSCCHVHWTKSFITSLRKTYKFCPN